jgi:uncharacterized protein
MRFALLLFCALLATLARAEDPRTLMWADLVPKGATAENPFAKLGRDPLLWLSDVAAIRDRRARADKTLTAADDANEQALVRKLEASGHDVEALLETRRQTTARNRAQARLLVSALDGVLVRLPGYVLPLEVTGKKVTEFLLVPWVGACIHTPPPPANQIVHVKTDIAFELSGLFMPVWVTGRLSAAATKQALYLVDGASDIDIGYTVKSARVEAYRP